MEATERIDAGQATDATCPQCGYENRGEARFCNHCGASLTSGRVMPSPGQTMRQGQYRIVRPLDKGGMGALYLAADTQAFDRLCVIKEMLDYFDVRDPEQVTKAHQRFEDEARALARLKHPSIPDIYAYFSEDNRNYIVMQYVEGQNLAARLTQGDLQQERQPGDPLPVEEVADYGIQLCRVLEYLARQQPPVVHHDIKPANIIVDQEGVAHLVDFGTAKARLTLQPGGQVGLQKSSVYGTIGYAPPEQYQGQSEPRSDVYALAATMYHLLTGDDPRGHPFQFPKLNTLPDDVHKALKEALQPDVTQRPPARAFREQLQAFVQPLVAPRQIKGWQKALAIGAATLVGILALVICAAGGILAVSGEMDAVQTALAAQNATFIAQAMTPVSEGIRMGQTMVVRSVLTPTPVPAATLPTATPPPTPSATWTPLPFTVTPITPPTPSSTREPSPTRRLPTPTVTPTPGTPTATPLVGLPGGYAYQQTETVRGTEGDCKGTAWVWGYVYGLNGRPKPGVWIQATFEGGPWGAAENIGQSGPDGIYRIQLLTGVKGTYRVTIVRGWQDHTPLSQPSSPIQVTDYCQASRFQVDWQEYPVPATATPWPTPTPCYPFMQDGMVLPGKPHCGARVVVVGVIQQTEGWLDRILVEVRCPNGQILRPPDAIQPDGAYRVELLTGVTGNYLVYLAERAYPHNRVSDYVQFPSKDPCQYTEFVVNWTRRSCP